MGRLRAGELGESGGYQEAIQYQPQRQTVHIDPGLCQPHRTNGLTYRAFSCAYRQVAVSLMKSTMAVQNGRLTAAMYAFTFSVSVTKEEAAAASVDRPYKSEPIRRN